VVDSEPFTSNTLEVLRMHSDRLLGKYQGYFFNGLFTPIANDLVLEGRVNLDVLVVSESVEAHANDNKAGNANDSG